MTDASLPPRIHTAKEFIVRNGNVLFFIGGFIFDTFTMVRIDCALDLVWQFVYLVVITALMIAQIRHAQGRWTPTGLIAKFWHHETEALHFCYGGLLSGYIIFYFKSTSFSRSLVFLTLIAALMVLNEMPQVRRWGALMRLGLYAFCVVSYLNYLLPVLIGRMGWLIFLGAWLLAGIVTYYVIKAVVRYAENPPRMFRRLSWSPGGVLVLILALYFFKLIPPVPLSLRHLGIYRAVEKVGDHYSLTYRQPPWYEFWETDNRVFPARPGDQIFSFISVFAPRRFSHRIFIKWSKWEPRRNTWLVSDRLPIALTGGRNDGFRGFLRKENYDAGRWKVDVETDDERVLGTKTFWVEEDSSTGDRRLKERKL
jgi:hypothetical protein